MCGILGRWQDNCYAGSHLGPKILDQLAHRGPDDRGHTRWATPRGSLLLGHTRLAVIDLSKRGHQPMESTDGRYALTYNGEIYNYRELRDELSLLGTQFSTDTDTEVLLAAWSAWGAACLDRLVGMFAFAVLDRVGRTLTCVRDAFGVKPLFYLSERAAFTFASEIPPLLEATGRAHRLDTSAVYDYLMSGTYDVRERTFLADVRALPPGSLLRVDLDDCSTSHRQWWSPSVGAAFEGTFEEAAEALRESFLESVRLHMRSDVPMGAALSGGIDSSAIVCAIRHLDPSAEIRAVTYVSGDHRSEAAWAKMVAEHVSAELSEVRLSESDLASDFPELILTQGEPFGGTSIYAQYGVMRRARELGLTVMLEGQGADELFGGYQGYPGHIVRSHLDNWRIAEAVRFLRQWHRWPGRTWSEGLRSTASQLAPRSSTKGIAMAWLRHPSWIRQAATGVRRPAHFLTPEPPIRGRRMMAALQGAIGNSGLPALLRHSDRNAMHFSVESRVPFLTVAQAELSLSMPESYLVSPTGETKSVLRAALRGIVPDPVLDRRDKNPFAAPQRTWMPGLLRQHLPTLDRDVTLPPFIDVDAALQALREVAEQRRGSTDMDWRLLNLLMWSQMLNDRLEP